MTGDHLATNKRHKFDCSNRPKRLNPVISTLTIKLNVAFPLEECYVASQTRGVDTVGERQALEAFGLVIQEGKHAIYRVPFIAIQP